MALFRDAVCVIVSMASPRNTGWDSSHMLVTVSHSVPQSHNFKKIDFILLKHHADLKASRVEFS